MQVIICIGSFRYVCGYDLSVDVGIKPERPMTVSKAGTGYELIVSNASLTAYELVSTVDGVDVVSGREGNDANPGYLIFPGETLVINGVYKNQHEVSALRFAKVPPIAGDGAGAKPGIIRLALFAERGAIETAAG